MALLLYPITRTRLYTQDWAISGRVKLSSTLVQLLLSFDRGMRVEKTSMQTLPSQLPGTPILILSGPYKRKMMKISYKKVSTYLYRTGFQDAKYHLHCTWFSHLLPWSNHACIPQCTPTWMVWHTECKQSHVGVLVPLDSEQLERKIGLLVGFSTIMWQQIMVKFWLTFTADH